MQVYFALLFSNAVQTRVEIEAISVAKFEQKLNNMAWLLPKNGFHLLLKLWSKFKQLVVTNEYINAEIEHGKFVVVVDSSVEELLNHQVRLQTPKLLILELTVLHKTSGD